MVNSETPDDIQAAIKQWSKDVEALADSGSNELENDDASQEEASTQSYRDQSQDDDDLQPLNDDDVATEAEESDDSDVGERLLQEARTKNPSPKVRVNTKQDPAVELALKDLQYRPEFDGWKLEEVISHARDLFNPKPRQTPVDSESVVAPGKKESKAENDPWSNLSSEDLAEESQRLLNEAEALQADVLFRVSTFELDADKGREELARALDMKKQSRLAHERSLNVKREEAARLDNEEAEFYASQDRVVAARPEAADPNSRYNKRMRQIDQAWEKSGDARAYDPRKPELIAEILDLEFGYDDDSTGKPDPKQMQKTNPPKRASQVKTVQSRSRAAAAPAPGSASRGKTQTPVYDLDRVRSIEDFEAMLRKGL